MKMKIIHQSHKLPLHSKGHNTKKNPIKIEPEMSYLKQVRLLEKVQSHEGDFLWSKMEDILKHVSPWRTPVILNEHSK